MWTVTDTYGKLLFQYPGFTYKDLAKHVEKQLNGGAKLKMVPDSVSMIRFFNKEGHHKCTAIWSSQPEKNKE